MEARNEILELSVRFALDIIAFTDVLEIKKKYVIADIHFASNYR